MLLKEKLVTRTDPSIQIIYLKSRLYSGRPGRSCHGRADRERQGDLQVPELRERIPVNRLAIICHFLATWNFFKRNLAKSVGKFVLLLSRLYRQAKPSVTNIKE